MNVKVKNGKKRSRVEYEYGFGRYDNGQFYEEELTDEALIATGKAVYDVMVRAPHETRRTKRLISWTTWGRCMGIFYVPREDGEVLAQQLREIFAMPSSTVRDRDEDGRRLGRSPYPKEWEDYTHKCVRLMDGFY
jgi:hypothetical protein